MLFASVLRSFTGFGFALAAVPSFSLFLPPGETVVLSACPTLAISLLGLRTFWELAPLRPMAPLLTTALLGTAMGAAFLSTINLAQFQLYVGLSVIAACLGMVFVKPSRHFNNSAISGLTGLVSGLMNGAFAIPGPPMIIYAMLYQPEPQKSRALLMTFFMATSLLALATYGIAGFIKPQSIGYVLLAFPALYAGDKLGQFLFNKYGSALYRRIALAGLATIGVTMTLRALL